jgi:hypothetical protein
LHGLHQEGQIMAGEKPGEHPLSDILIHRREVYGPDVDELIRGISEFSSKYELYEWWNREINWSTDRAEVERKAEARFQELFQRSNMSGWGNN